MSERRVLVIRGGAIGDFILTLPVLQLLRESIPGVEIHTMGNRGIVELATVSRHSDAIHYLDAAGMAMLFAKGVPVHPPLAEWLSGFNVVLSYLYDPDGIFRENLLIAGVKTLLDAPHRVQEEAGHASEQLAKPLQKLAMFLEPGSAPHLSHPDAEAKPPDRIRIAIHPGSGSIKKNWAVEHWARAGQEIAKMLPNAQLALITGEAELERGVTDHIAQAWRNIDLIHWNCLPLPELARVMPSSHGFLGHDSGMSHLAAACGVPCHTFFGPTNPATWAPSGSPVTVLRPDHRDLGLLSWEDGWRSLEAFVTRLG